MEEPSKALVLAGGGVAGIAWELGLITGLCDGGVDVTSPDLIVGTSAGSTVGAQITSGVPLVDLGERQLSNESREIQVELDVEEFRASIADLVSGASSQREMLARVGRMALEATTVPEATRREVIAARLPVHEWPSQPLVVTAIEAASGEFTVFGRDSGVPLVDAVAASCAVPGIWPPVTIGRHRYVDGGIRSVSNADLAAGHDRVLVLLPMTPEGPVKEQLDVETSGLEEGGSITLTIATDEASVSAIGSNPLDPSRRPAAYRAGLEQGRSTAGDLGGFWA